MRSVESSLKRMGLDRLDILWIHDPDTHWEQAIGGAFPALAQLREQGVVSAIGAGMNQAEMLARFAREGDFDAFMCAGRYTLLDQPPLEELFPLCDEKGIAIVIAGVMNSGLLANPSSDSHFDYGPAPRTGSTRRWPSRPSASGTACRCGRRPCSSPSPTRRSRRGRRRAHHRPSRRHHRKMSFPIPDALWDELEARACCRKRRPRLVAARRSPGSGRASMRRPSTPPPFLGHLAADRDYYWMGDDLAAIRGVRAGRSCGRCSERGIDRTVIVQTIPSVAETEDFLATAAATDFVAGVVGWVDLTDPAVGHQLGESQCAAGRALPGRHPPPGPR